MKTDYDEIKDLYGEKMAKFCRSNFPTIMAEGKMFDILYSTFAPTKVLYLDLKSDINFAKDFQQLIFSEFEKQKLEKKKEFLSTELTPEELMRSKGYILKECKTVEEVAEYQKYYESNELLCTFNNIEGRLKGYHIFFAVKENVDEIKRENFSNPERQDEYGTSVMSLQISKSVGSLSIKNRYNHTVENPDCTFGNNLENIVEGLTYSFEKYYGIKIEVVPTRINLQNYIKGNDGKYYRYISERNNINFCADNIIIQDGAVIKVDKSRFLVFDYFILDRKKKKIVISNNVLRYRCVDSFPEYFNDKNHRHIEKIDVINTENGKLVKLYISEQTDNYQVEIHLNEFNQMITYKDDYIEYIPKNFLNFCPKLHNIYLKNAKKIDDGAFSHVKPHKIEIPNVLELGDDVFFIADELETFDAPLLEDVGNDVLHLSNVLKTINVPKLKHVKGCFLFYNSGLEEANFPSLISCGNGMLTTNRLIKKFNAQNLEMAGNAFLRDADLLTEINIPNIQVFGDNALISCCVLKKLYIPKCEIVGHHFLEGNRLLKEIDISSLRLAGKCFLSNNMLLTSFIAPRLIALGDDSLRENRRIEYVYTPKLEEVNSGCFQENKNLRQAIFPELTTVCYGFFEQNQVMEVFHAPKLACNRENTFMLKNESMKDFYCPSFRPRAIEGLLMSHSKKFDGKDERFVIQGLTNKDEDFEEKINGGYNKFSGQQKVDEDDYVENVLHAVWGD